MGLIRSFRGLIKPTSFNIIPSSVSVKIGTTYEIPYIVLPENATNQKAKWTSSDTNIATVSNGIITPVAVGTATITGSTDYLGFTDTISVEVYVIPVTGVTLNESSITVYAGEPFQLVATVSPSDAGEQGVTWSSNNTSVATVSSNGLVTYVSDGDATITVTTVEGGFTATCSVECESAKPVSETFTYTGSDQSYTIPYTQCYKLEAWGAGGRSAKGGYGSGIMCLTKGTELKIMVGARGNNGNGTKYGFGGSANGGSNAAGGGLSGIFTGTGTILATDSDRALVIGGGAGGNSAGTGGAGGGETGGTGTGSYGTAGGGGTQTSHGSGGNAGACQFNGGNGSGTYGYGGGGGWWGGRGSQGDGSADDDKGGGGGSGYVISTASDRTLTQGGGMSAGCDGCVKISSI